MLPSGQENEREVHMEEGEVQNWSEGEWEWWELKEDQEYEQDEDEEDDDDDDDNEEEEGEGEDDDEKEEDMKEDMGGASVAIDLCVVCLARPRNASTW